MKTLFLALMIALPAWADVGPKTAPPKDKAPEVPEVENIGNMDVQMEEDQMRGSAMEKQRQMEEDKKTLDENEEDVRRVEKDY